MAPTIYTTDMPCPKCGTHLIQLDQKSHAYGCSTCQITWVLKDGKLVPALEDK